MINIIKILHEFAKKQIVDFESKTRLPIKSDGCDYKMIGDCLNAKCPRSTICSANGGRSYSPRRAGNCTKSRCLLSYHLATNDIAEAPKKNVTPF